ncbi:MAG: hypothetical protein HZB09_01545 [Candidatus Yonathbacteria bacterium]|nr:hypothetical protein [Candidatus Yonathbacteria bacterium]
MIMKKYLFGFAVTLTPFITFAHGMEGMDDSGFWSQMQELSPLTHVDEGHWYTVIALAILWAVFVWGAYSLAKKCTKKGTSGPTV